MPHSCTVLIAPDWEPISISCSSAKLGPSIPLLCTPGISIIMSSSERRRQRASGSSGGGAIRWRCPAECRLAVRCSGLTSCCARIMPIPRSSCTVVFLRLRRDCRAVVHGGKSRKAACAWDPILPSTGPPSYLFPLTSYFFPRVTFATPLRTSNCRDVNLSLSMFLMLPFLRGPADLWAEEGDYQDSAVHD